MKKPYGHVGYTRRSKSGKLSSVAPKGAKKKKNGVDRNGHELKSGDKIIYYVSSGARSGKFLGMEGEYLRIDVGHPGMTHARSKFIQRDVSTAAVAAQGGSTMSKGIECPHCHEGISRQYAVKSLAVLAKSEGADIGEELEALAGEGEEAEGEEPEVEKSAKKLGNEMHPHRGPAGGHLSSSRGKGTGEQKSAGAKPKAKNVEKSFRFPAIVGNPQVVNYVGGTDADVAKSMEEGGAVEEPRRNLRAERERATGQATPE